MLVEKVYGTHKMIAFVEERGDCNSDERRRYMDHIHSFKIERRLNWKFNASQKNFIISTSEYDMDGLINLEKEIIIRFCSDEWFYILYKPGIVDSIVVNDKIVTYQIANRFICDGLDGLDEFLNSVI